MGTTTNRENATVVSVEAKSSDDAYRTAAHEIHGVSVEDGEPTHTAISRASVVDVGSNGNSPVNQARSRGSTTKSSVVGRNP